MGQFHPPKTVIKRSINISICNEKDFVFVSEWPMPSLNQARRLHGCGKFQDSAGKHFLIVAGGISTNPDEPLNSVEILSLKPDDTDETKWKTGKKWENVPSMKISRSHFPTVGVYGAQLIIAGGKNRNGIGENSVEVFSFESQNWEVNPELSLENGRYGHSTAFFQQSLCKKVISDDVVFPRSLFPFPLY